MALLMILKNEKLFNTDNTMDIEIKITIPQELKADLEQTGKILKAQQVDQEHHLIVDMIATTTLQELKADLEQTGKIPKAQQVDQAHHLIVDMIATTIPQELKADLEQTGKILKAQQVDQAHHLIVIQMVAAVATLQDLVVAQVVVEDGKKNVGATPRGCPSHGRLQGAAPTVCKIYFIRSETK